jgi:hydroxypyruvate isomerase
MNQNLVPSVCVDAVFEGVPFEQACAAVQQAGIPAIEFWAWWDKDLDAVQAATTANNLNISACCTKFISLVDPARRDDYLQGLADSIKAAHRLGFSTLISQVGDFRNDCPREQQHQSLVDGLREAASLLKETDVTLVIEPLNELVDHAGYYLVRSDEAFQIVDEVDNPNIKVVFDIYHQQISEGHLIKNISSNIDKIGHFHAAGNPGRRELQHGEIHYPHVFQAIRESPFHGYVGLEYWPLQDDPVPALHEVAQWLNA